MCFLNGVQHQLQRNTLALSHTSPDTPVTILARLTTCEPHYPNGMLKDDDNDDDDDDDDDDFM
ncbi:hypothetical protein E2C01_089570 [Portunus trituberculatus]|uniref:Uncharacterized protein n=1 Tax=Portunus trituberculatus TaxID=210409 RepID=A0A5B7JDW2_PORTR|nr:hypothetical protein [Portunus trituberculatus]